MKVNYTCQQYHHAKGNVHLIMDERLVLSERDANMNNVLFGSAVMLATSIGLFS